MIKAMSYENPSSGFDYQIINRPTYASVQSDQVLSFEASRRSNIKRAFKDEHYYTTTLQMCHFIAITIFENITCLKYSLHKYIMDIGFRLKYVFYKRFYMFIINGFPVFRRQGQADSSEHPYELRSGASQRQNDTNLCE